MSKGVPVGEMVGSVVPDTDAVVEGEWEDDMLGVKEERGEKVALEETEGPPVTLTLPVLDPVLAEVALAKDVPVGGAAELESRGEEETLLETESERDMEVELVGEEAPETVEVALAPVGEEEGVTRTEGVADTVGERELKLEEE